MSDDILDLLREFRASGPAPSAEARALAQTRVEAEAARMERRLVVPLVLRGRRAVVAAVGVTTAAAAVGLLLATPWQHGPGALTPAQAANVLRRVTAATAPKPGWVFHERTVTLAPGMPERTEDIWRQDARPYRFRVVSRAAGDTPSVEVGGTREPARVFVYDGATRRLYLNPPQIPLRRGAYQDQAVALRQQLAGKPVTPQGGHWKVEARTKIDGRSVYKLTLVMPPPMGYVGLTYYADAKTYVPVRIESVAGPSGTETQVTHVEVYEYLPPTVAGLKLADIRVQHAETPVLPGTRMPPRVLMQLGLR